MMADTLIPKIKVSDIPVEPVQLVKTVGVVKSLTQKSISNGYIQVDLELGYFRADGKETSNHFYWNLKPEWFSPQFSQMVKETRENKEKGGNGPLQDNELVAYNINVSGLTRGLMQAAGIEDIDFEGVIGSTVGFKTKARKTDPSRADISFFFKPKAQ